ncbi:hypothetical protein EMA8858_01189 [Emticicia aquatica]|uniref:TIGR02453 family protein n=1 Tax=Emticicia aquatica TaxID=1681835 RepID=A0ABN8EQ88_9BACT|nr:DUF2461 domain-containing protein [Emticicia aquatica]CAH0995069.1 hypothetical protein EMA8858_01189 [Emticicia aquatica]
MLTHHTLQFLTYLQENNNREWFQSNKKDYEKLKEEFEALCQDILSGLTLFQEDLINTKVKDCIFRINRDVRFSKDKSPYKNYISAAFGPGGRHSNKIDFYIQIQPDATILGGGMWAPTPTQLASFRQEIDYNPAMLKGIIEDESFNKYFNEIHGEKVKKMPKGYPIDHPDIELLKYKQLFFVHRYKNDEVFNPTFANEIVTGCKILKPYLDYVNHLFFEENN